MSWGRTPTGDRYSEEIFRPCPLFCFAFDPCDSEIKMLTSHTESMPEYFPNIDYDSIL
jgi:hypothetical protein